MVGISRGVVVRVTELCCSRGVCGGVAMNMASRGLLLDSDVAIFTCTHYHCHYLTLALGLAKFMQ